MHRGFLALRFVRSIFLSWFFLVPWVAGEEAVPTRKKDEGEAECCWKLGRMQFSGWAGRGLRPGSGV